MNDAICLFDMDGTLCDFEGAMNAKLAELGTLSKGKQGAARRLIKSQPGFWRNLPPLETGFAILNAVRFFGFETHILTKGPENTPSAWTEKLEWCQARVPDLPVTITMRKSLVYGRVLVDDWPEYFLSWLEVRPRGLVIAPAHAYNADVSHPNVLRYDGSVAVHEKMCHRLKAAKERR